MRSLILRSLTGDAVLGRGRVPARRALRRGLPGWRISSGDPGGTRYSSLDQIHRGNVSGLELAWKYRTGDMQKEPASTIQCTPIVIDGRMYLTTPGLKVVALDAASGRKLWQFDPFPGQRARGTNRGLAYWKHGREERLFASAGSDLYALDPGTGTLIASFGHEDRVDLRRGLDRDVFSLSVTATSPGIVYEDLLILGSAVGEGPAPAAPGHVRAFDVRSGQRRWIFHTIPHRGRDRPRHLADRGLEVGGRRQRLGRLDPGRRPRPRFLRHRLGLL